MNVHNILAHVKVVVSLHRRLALATIAVIGLAPCLLVLLAYSVIAPYRQYVLDPAAGQTIIDKNVRVGIVLGAGITADNKPFKELQSRLDTAADALQKGYVQRLLLSGDNRFPGYNEPQAMQTYLMTVKHVSPLLLQMDYAGRSTYESCERAAKVFELDSTIIFSARSHLPRAIYLCRNFGVTAYGIASPAEANNSFRREALARVKALINVYIWGEKTVLGKPIEP